MTHEVDGDTKAGGDTEGVVIQKAGGGTEGGGDTEGVVIQKRVVIQKAGDHQKTCGDT